MDVLLLSVVGIAALALLFDFSNGFHDAANSISTVVATGTMSPRLAVWFSAVCNFAAILFVGTAVANTVAKTVDARAEGVAVIFCALVGAIAWNYLTWYVGMPSSSSHALIGGLVGAGLSAGGTDVINWESVRKTLAAIIASPLVAFTVAAIAVGLVTLLSRVTGWRDDARPFKVMQLISAGAVSFGHGANDAQKTMGVIAALLVSAGYLNAPEGAPVPVPLWLAVAAYGAIAMGTVWGGWRIVETMGFRLTTLNARTGVAANIGATTAIFGATALGIPISTTHAAGSSVVGVGAASRRGLNWRVIGRMLLAWVVTMPAAGFASWAMYRLTQLPTPLAVICVGALLAALSAWIVYAMWHAKAEHAGLTSVQRVPLPDVDKAPAA